MTAPSTRMPTAAAHDAYPLFAGSAVRHGTHSGWSRHKRDGEDPCDACYRAKQTYDQRRLQSPALAQRNRLRAKAQSRALHELARRYKAEYDALYKGCLAEIFGGAE